MDAASPFVSLAANSQRQQGEQKRRRRPYSTWFDADVSHTNKTIQSVGSFASFENKTNSFPTLRPATGTHMLFSQPLQKLQKELPPPPLNKNPAFNTPRKLEPDYNDSSGVENTSPENNADSEATPDNMGWRSKITKIKSSVTNFAEKNSQKNNAVFSHGGTDSPKAGSLQPFYSLNIEKRRKKKSEKDKRLALRKNSSASDSEDTTKGKDRRNANITAVPAGPGQLASLFGFIECHPNLPHILSFYAQLLLNFFLVFLFIYMVYCFWSTIRSDIDKKSEEAMTDILAEMAICAQNYRENRCDPSTRMPALETICNNWERCMNRDPRALGRAKVSAHTFAEIFNSFIEPISYKAMVCDIIFQYISNGIHGS